MKNISLYALTILLLALPATAGNTANAGDSSALSVSASKERRSDTVMQLDITQQQATKTTKVSSQAYQSHVWFHSVEVFLSGDINANGYYHRLEVELDADTSAPYLQVFAELSLLPGHGAERVYYTSSVFELFGQSADDWLAINTVLEHQFAADEYLLTVRLYDAATGYLLAEISGFDDANLDYIPLEDYARDSYIGSSTVEVSAGSTGILLFCALCLLLWQRRYTTVIE